MFEEHDVAMILKKSVILAPMDSTILSAYVD